MGEIIFTEHPEGCSLQFINAEFINDTDVEIIFTEEGVEKTFIVNLYTGKGNIFDVV